MSTTTATKAPETITIALTDSRPVRVQKRLWPIIAKASHDRDHNNQELFRRHYLRVRRHAILLPDGADDTMQYYGADKCPTSKAPHPDNQVIITGEYSTSWQGEADHQAGCRCTLDKAAEKIREIGNAIDAPDWLIDECIADLPAIDADTETHAAELLAGFTDAEIAAEYTRRQLA